MKLQLTIEDAIECFGRQWVANQLTRAIKMQHGYEVRKQLTNEDRTIYSPERAVQRFHEISMFTQLNVEVI